MYSIFHGHVVFRFTIFIIIILFRSGSLDRYVLCDLFTHTIKIFSTGTGVFVW